MVQIVGLSFRFTRPQLPSTFDDNIKEVLLHDGYKYRRGGIVEAVTLIATTMQGSHVGVPSILRPSA